MAHRQLFLPLLILLLAFSVLEVEGSPPPGSALSGTVTWVYDGDTLHVEPYGKVRLIGIDTPEDYEALLGEGWRT